MTTETTLQPDFDRDYEYPTFGPARLDPLTEEEPVTVESSGEFHEMLVLRMGAGDVVLNPREAVALHTTIEGWIGGRWEAGS